MSNKLAAYEIDHVEIYAPMAKALAYWHIQALGFTLTDIADIDSGRPGVASYVLESGSIRLVLTSVYPMNTVSADNEIAEFVARNYCGVRRFALRVDDVTQQFESSIAGGAIPVRYPRRLEDKNGFIEEAAIRLYENNEIVFINREGYDGSFKPGYRAVRREKGIGHACLFEEVDHIAAEVRINQSGLWTRYLNGAIGVSLVQSIESGEDNETGMILRINQSPDRKLTLVIAEPETYLAKSKVQKNIDTYGPGIHHLAFSTNDLGATIETLTNKGVEFVSFPPSYYALLRDNPEFGDLDIDSLEKHGILVDKEGETYLMQKFIKPISDRPFFFYEIVQRVNGYNGFALKNINVLKKAEEMEIMKTEKY